jgi:nucleoside-diphosphate-sugar epimerase
MFGPGDAFLTPLLAMLRRTPVFPMFGSGATRLQPVYVEDVAEAIVRILQAPAASQLHTLAGPRVYTYQELLRVIAASAGTRPLLVPFPFSLWHLIGYVSEVLPNPPITRNQVELMELDNVAEPNAPGFAALQISPQALENMLPEYLTADARGFLSLPDAQSSRCAWEPPRGPNEMCISALDVKTDGVHDPPGAGDACRH